MAKIAILFIKAYQKGLSPLLGKHCRFYPSCSNYAIESFQRHGFIKGSILTIWRILRCQPFCKGGYDPVPLEFPSCQKHHSCNGHI
ncbi:MAG TPA: membrane protein insertion efficiency factor YidD [Candidatus Hydrogenedens sp.]|nr:membrane protein insertion efficiency factor YidD [Candidatus Hydrogenedens sp.]